MTENKKNNQLGNLYGHPLAHYLDMYRSSVPQELGAQVNLSYFSSIQSFRFRFLGTLCQVTHPDFSISHLEKGTGVYPLEAASTARILLLRYLLEGTFERPTGTLLSYRDLPWGETYFRQFQGRCILRLARQYGQRIEAFRRIMERLHAVPLPLGNCAYQVEIFDQLSVCLILWEGDEEYPASAQILFSDNFASAFSAEDAAYACDIILDYLRDVETVSN